MRTAKTVSGSARGTGRVGGNGIAAKFRLHRFRPVIGIVGLGIAGLAAGCGLGQYNAPSGSVQLEPGAVIGKQVFPIGSTSTGGTGADVDSIPCNSGEDGFHIHIHLSLFVNGQQYAIPAGIGIPNPAAPVNGFIGNGDCFYELHTHDASGIIHLEASAPRNYTLGNFFDVWGEPLTSSNVAGYQGTVTAYVGGTQYNGDLRAIPLTRYEEITLEVGTPVVSPPTYIFPPGY